MTLKPSDIEALVELFGQSSWDEMRLEIGGAELVLSKRADAAASVAAPAAAPVLPPGAAPVAPTPVAPAVPAAPPPAAQGAPHADWVALKAENLGTFYRAPAPGAAPYVSVGDRVEPDTEVALVEVMKLFTTLRAGVAGVVREIVAQDGQMVEYGQVLMWIEPG